MADNITPGRGFAAFQGNQFAPMLPQQSLKIIVKMICYIFNGGYNNIKRLNSIQNLILIFFQILFNEIF